MARHARELPTCVVMPWKFVLSSHKGFATGELEVDLCGCLRTRVEVDTNLCGLHNWEHRVLCGLEFWE
jgi:hypothetical protein